MSFRQAEKNTRKHFLDFIHAALDAGVFEWGDALVIDNAAVHGGAVAEEQFRLLMQEHGVLVIRLPVYSPELNPCEFVFGRVKTNLRRHRTSAPILDQILETFDSVSHDVMRAFYGHCEKNRTRPIPVMST